jgi:uncharacterized protein YjbI with pentapeptide repeats
MNRISQEQFWYLLNSGKVSNVSLKTDVTRRHITTPYSNCVLKDSQFLNLDLGGQEFQGLNITGCTIHTLTLGDQSIEKPITIKKTEIKRLQISERVSSPLMAIDEETKIDEVDCSNTLIREFTLANVTIGKLRITNPKEHPRVSIDTPNPFTSIKIGAQEVKMVSVDCPKISLEVQSDVSFNNVKCSDEIVFSNCHQATTIALNNCYISKLTVVNQQIYAVTIKDGSFGELNLINARLNRISAQSAKGKVRFNRLTVDDRIDAVDLHNTVLEELSFQTIKRTEGIQLTNVEVSERISIIDSRIDNANFHNMNLHSCNFTLVDSSITESTFVNIRWPKHYLINESISKQAKNRIESLWRIREAYRQLKVVCETQQNKIDSLAFKKHELKIYWKIVNSESRTLSNLGDWLILGSNKLFSDFGQSIFRPLLWLLSVNLLLFNRLLALYDLGIKFDLHAPKWASFWRGLGLYLNLLNPVHNFELHGVSILGATDFTMRVLSSYFIYYFIRASRKFHTQ